MSNGDSVDFRTGLFGIKLTGPNSLITFLFLAILALSGLTLMQHINRQREHTEIVCMIKLNLFMNNIPKGEAIDWAKMPVDLYGCVPRFLYERGRQ